MSQVNCATVPLYFALLAKENNRQIKVHLQRINEENSIPRKHYVIYNFIQSQYKPKKKKEITVTLATFSTPDRVGTLKYIIEKWKGPISLAYYIKEPSDMEVLNEVLGSSLKHAQVQVNLVQNDGQSAFPINILRNIAEENIKTPLTFHSDIDFVPSKDIYTYLFKKPLNQVLPNVTSGNTILVIPSFEFANSRMSEQYIPDTKAELRDLVRNKDATPFQMKYLDDNCYKCQGSTRYTHWMKARNCYNITNIIVREEYEPFSITKTHITRWNEAFSGYGVDKHLFYKELRDLRGMETLVAPHIFIFHRNHEQSNDARLFRGAKSMHKKVIAKYRKERQRLETFYEIQRDMKSSNSVVPMLNPSFPLSEQICSVEWTNNATHEAMPYRRGYSLESEMILSVRSHQSEQDLLQITFPALSFGLLCFLICSCVIVFIWVVMKGYRRDYHTLADVDSKEKKVKQ